MGDRLFHQRSVACETRRFSATSPSNHAVHPLNLPTVGTGPAIQQHRKFSFPASLHSSLLGLTTTSGASSATANETSTAASSARRRFSNVSDAVSRKLSNTIGWRSAPVPTHDVVEQGKSLCSQYIRSRLKRSGVLNRKCGLQRMRGAAGIPGGVVVRDVFPELASIGQELERMHPKLYTSVARQASPSPACGTLASEKTAGMILTAVARELFKSDVTWGKVVSLFAVAGGLAVDCVRQGHPEYLQALLEAMGEVLEEELAPWIVGNGGWTALLAHCKPPNTEVSIAKFLGVFAAVMVAIIILLFMARWFGKLAFL